MIFVAFSNIMIIAKETAREPFEDVEFCLHGTETNLQNGE